MTNGPRVYVPRVVAVVALVAVGITARLAIGAAPGPSSATSRALQSGLSAVACPSPGRCVAVGFAGSLYGVGVPLAMGSAGGAWSVQPAGQPSQVAGSVLADVACLSPSACVAVGHQDVPAPYFGAPSAGGAPLVEAWDGDGWQIRAAPMPTGAVDAQLSGVDCASTICVAVGLAETTKGREIPFAESWDGTDWTVGQVPIPPFADDSELDDVACASRRSCVAVGHYTYEAQIFAGTAPLVEAWDGSAWSIEPSDNPKGSKDTELAAVACPSPGRCLAVGFQRSAGGRSTTFAEISVGAAWTISATVDPPRSPVTKLADVDCPLADRCMAVGEQRGHAGVSTFAESWDGVRWALERSPNPAGSVSSALIGVDCPSPTACVAVGGYRQRSLVERAFAAAWDGSSWTIERLGVA